MDYPNTEDRYHVVQAQAECDRMCARYHGDERYVELACTCGTCLHEEQAYDWLDWLAMQHHSQEDQRNWYALVSMYGYALPLPVWIHVVEYLRQCRADEAEAAERAAGWDPNP